MTALGANSREQLKSIVARIESLENEKKEVSDQIREVYADAKGDGLDVKALREIVRRRKQNAADLAEHEAVVETYMAALGMISDLPLGRAALKREGLVTE